jgi:Predicted dehydrogenases and related proteins
MQKLRWGVLSTAKIGRTKVIPAIQTSLHGEVVAICSRDAASAQLVADELGIPRAHGSYEALLADPDVDAIYNPLPNHLHVPWSIKALEAGKHVLCEKPLGLSAADVLPLLDAAKRYPHLKVMEAFMYRFHPQWDKARELVTNGSIGQVRHIHSHFSYNNREPENIRNNADMGGGALMDIGCYSISLSRYLFQSEPLRVFGHIMPYPGYEVDCFVSGILEFADGTATFTASTKIEGQQFMEASGESGSVFLPVPFSPVADTSAKVLIKRNDQREELVIDSCDHYRNMADAFAESIFKQQPVPTPLSDALANMKIIDAVFASAASGNWVSLNW